MIVSFHDTRARASILAGPSSYFVGGGLAGTQMRARSAPAADTADLGWEKQLLEAFNHSAPIARSLGMTLSFDPDKSAVVSLAYSTALTSAARPPRQTGAVHGGLYGVIADTAGEHAGSPNPNPKR